MKALDSFLSLIVMFRFFFFFFNYGDFLFEEALRAFFIQKRPVLHLLRTIPTLSIHRRPTRAPIYSQKNNSSYRGRLELSSIHKRPTPALLIKGDSSSLLFTDYRLETDRLELFHLYKTDSSSSIHRRQTRAIQL